MRRTNLRMLAPVMLLLCSVASVASGQARIRIVPASGIPGRSVSVWVELVTTVPCTAAMVRLDYPSAVFENPSVTAGPLVTSGHVWDSHKPATGRLNAAAHGLSGMPPFANQTGVLFVLNFDIKKSANPGEVPITFTSAGTPVLPASDLVDTAGLAMAHIVVGGAVTIGQSGARRSWMLYR